MEVPRPRQQEVRKKEGGRKGYLRIKREEIVDVGER